MEYILILLIIIFIISKLKPRQKIKKKEQVDSQEIELNLDGFYPSNYKQKDFIVTKNEYFFYKELKKYTDKNSQIIFIKLGMKELFDVAGNSKYYQANFWRIAQKHIDFVICSQGLYPLYAIELDDGSHKNEETQKADYVKDQIFQQSRIRLIRVQACPEYTEEQVKRIIESAYSQNGQAIIVTSDLTEDQ